MSSGGTEWFHQTKAVFLKDWRAERRTRVTLSAVGVFSLSSLWLMGLATASLRNTKGFSENLFFRVYADTDSIDSALAQALFPAWEAIAKWGLLWVLLCFAAFSGLSHSFVHEEETGTTMALRLTATPNAVFIGKLAFNFTLLLVITTIITPLYMVITGLTLGTSPIVFLIALIFGCVGLASAATIIAALAAKARGTGALYGALGLPLIFVYIALLLNAGAAVYTKGHTPINMVRDLGGLLSYGVALIAISTMVFPLIWED